MADLKDNTGSLVFGTAQGLANGLSPMGKVVNVNGNPNNRLSQAPMSGIAFDVTNGVFYMYIGGSSWNALS